MYTFLPDDQFLPASAGRLPAALQHADPERAVQIVVLSASDARSQPATLHMELRASVAADSLEDCTWEDAEWR